MFSSLVRWFVSILLIVVVGTLLGWFIPIVIAAVPLWGFIVALMIVGIVLFMVAVWCISHEGW